MTEDEKYKIQKNIQTLNTIAFIGAPVSLLIGGVLLGCITVVCAIVSVVKANRIINEVSVPSNLDLSLKKQSIIAVVISIACLAIDISYFITLMSTLIPALEAVQSGNIEDFYKYLSQPDGSLNNGSSNPGKSSGSVWD